MHEVLDDRLCSNCRAALVRHRRRARVRHVVDANDEPAFAHPQPRCQHLERGQDVIKGRALDNPEVHNARRILKGDGHRPCLLEVAAELVAVVDGENVITVVHEGFRRDTGNAADVESLAPSLGGKSSFYACFPASYATAELTCFSEVLASCQGLLSFSLSLPLSLYLSLCE